ncbi:interleukin-17F-like [Clavelina lepadiformis]|uniref:interleukin-17F-like n=1 Tax=Clavelina lepadiformis TaxID=159417 RepID=UPI004042AD73
MSSTEVPQRFRSMSPFEYCIDRDQARFPRDVVKAKCVCNEACFDSSGRRTRATVSMPVDIHMSVIHLDGVSGVEQCTKSSCFVESLRVSVGFHCTSLDY